MITDIYHCNIIDYLVSVKVADSLGLLDKTRQCCDSGGGGGNGGGAGCGQVTRGRVTWSTGDQRPLHTSVLHHHQSGLS